MGTRNLTCVYLDGDYRVAQYGQWDGYPQGQGLTCLEFLRSMDEERFKEQLQKRSFASRDYIRGIYAAFGAQGGMISADDADRLGAKFPEYHRNLAADILKMIMDDKVSMLLKSDLNFAADSLFCEWAYVIDFDTRTFEVYEGFNQKPLTESDRFFFLEEESKKDWREERYHPVKLVRSWSLDDLPTVEEFLNTFEEEIE